MQKKKKNILITVLATFILLATVLALIITQTDIIYPYRLTPPEENKSKTKEINEEPQEYENYKLYKDEYVQFQYPQEAKIEVNSGLLNERAAKEFVGVESIFIKDLLYTGVVYIGGSTVVEYDLNDPNFVNIGGHTNDMNKHKIVKIWFKQLDNKLYLASFTYELDNETKSLNLLLEKESNSKFTGVEEYIDSKYTNFLYYTEGTYLDITPEEYKDSSEFKPSFEVKCTINSEDEFNKCYKDLNVFFNTAKPLRNDSATKETDQEDYKYCRDASECVAVDCGC